VWHGFKKKQYNLQVAVGNDTISKRQLNLKSSAIVIVAMIISVAFYHFAFLITSLAILDSGIGGMIAFKKENISSIVTDYNIILPLSYLFIILTIYLLPFLDNLIYYSILATIPFLITGIIISTKFKKNSHISNRIYFADLSGSAIGRIVILLFLNEKKFIYSLFVIALVGSIGSFLLVDLSIKLRNIIQILSIILIGIILYQGSVIEQIETNFLSYYTSPNTVRGSLKDTKRSVNSVDFI